MKRKIYLNKMSLKEAREKFLNFFKDIVVQGEEIEVTNAANRVTAEAIYARRSAPHYAASAMDGIAVNVSDTVDARETNPVYLKEGVNAFWVDTGDPIPDGCNAVIKVEEVNFSDDKLVIEKSAAPWQNIRSIGESVIKGQMVLPVNHLITPYHLGALLEAGIIKIKVRKKPRVGIIPTGSELIPPTDIPEKGQLIEFNSTILSSYIQEWGGDPHITEIIADEYSLLKEKILQEVEANDITLIIAGSSAGEEDYTVRILSEVGQVLVHGINIMPGKPLILAEVMGKPVIGLPGYPLAAILNNYLFVRTLIYSFLGLMIPETPSIEGVIKRKIPSAAGVEEYLRVNLAWIKDEIIAVPKKKGSAAMESLVNADGILVIPEEQEGLDPGSKVNIFLLKGEREVENNLLLIGSHDMTLDILANFLREKRAGFDLITQSVGSMAGLMALKREEAHLAGAHLLDENTGEYNVSFVKKVLGDKEMALINLVCRQQGIMVKKNNPKKIKDIQDLLREDIMFINRQRGAGTRVLLDYLLKKLNISSESIKGYDREEYTHIAAAVAVLTDSADAALGIMAAANAMELDFIPIAEERYDLVIPSELLDDWRVKYLIETIKAQSFKRTIEKLGGYRTDKSGEIVLIKGGRSESE